MLLSERWKRQECTRKPRNVKKERAGRATSGFCLPLSQGKLGIHRVSPVRKKTDEQHKDNPVQALVRRRSRSVCSRVSRSCWPCHFDVPACFGYDTRKPRCCACTRRGTIRPGAYSYLRRQRAS